MVRKHRPRHRRLIATVIFTSILLGLIALALGDTNPGIAIAALISVAALATVFHFVLPGGDFFSAVFANSIGIYACVYVFFISENFDGADTRAQDIGFVLPLVGFLCGVLWHRRKIAAAVERSDEQMGKDIWHATIWIPPLIAVGAASFLAPLRGLAASDQNVVLLGSMTIIALTALLAAADIAAFLLDIAILFEDFLKMRPVWPSRHLHFLRATPCWRLCLPACTRFSIVIRRPRIFCSRVMGTGSIWAKVCTCQW